MQQIDRACASPGRIDEAWRQVRAATLHLVADLAAEDSVAQSMPETSPAKWHLAHTTWFFEQFVLARDARYRFFNEDWLFLFNSYYQSVGPMHARPQRGLLTRPTLAEVLAYRACIDERMDDLLAQGIHLVGGGAMLRGLDLRLANATGVPVQLVRQPLESVVLGAGRVIESYEELRDMFMEARR